MFINPLQESLNVTCTRLKIVVLLPYLFPTFAETAGSFQACPNNKAARDSCVGLLAELSCSPGVIACCQTCKAGEGGKKSQRGRRNSGTNVCQSVIWSRAFSKWTVHKALSPWETGLLLTVSESAPPSEFEYLLGLPLGERTFICL